MPRSIQTRFRAPVRGPGRTLALLALAAALGPPALAQDTPAAWIDTWSASPQPIWSADFFAPVDIPRALRDQTIRQVARVSLGGEQIRVELSNEYGTQRLVIGAAHIALAGADGAVVPGSDHALTFGGKPGISVPPGAPIWSDPVDLAVEALGSVAVSLYLPDITPATTWHREGAQTTLISASGDVTAEVSFEPAQDVNSRIFFSGLAVPATAEARAVVLFGDSITDGAASTPNENRRWPDRLAERLAAAGADLAVLNEGISGARVLRDRMGENALARFDRDVLSHPRAATVVVMMGINDIGWPGTLLVPPGEVAPTPGEIIAGYEQLIERAHAHGLRIIGATLTPFEDTFHGGPLFGYFDTEKEAKREAVNAWIRTSGAYDAVIDFDAVTRDPANPLRIRAEFDSGDHLHPNDAGYAAMADSIDLTLLGLAQ